MNTLSIVTKGKTTDHAAPSNWNECTEAQLLSWGAICLKKLDLPDAVRLSIIVFYNIPFKVFKTIPEAGKVQLAHTLPFLFGENNLVKWIIPKIEQNKQTYYGPADRLENLTIGEFSKTELYYQIYVKQNNPLALDMLIAALYRPQRNGLADRDIREDFTEIGTKDRAEQFSTLEPKLRQAILLNYEGCRNFIRKNFLDKLPNDGKGEQQEIFDFNKVILNVAGGKFGTKSETDKAWLFDFLQHLLDTAEEIARMKKQ
jgi:hypothetical protein